MKQYRIGRNMVTTITIQADMADPDYSYVTMRQYAYRIKANSDSMNRLYRLIVKNKAERIQAKSIIFYRFNS